MLKRNYKEKVEKLLEDAEKALNAQAWTSASSSYDSAIEGILRYYIKQKYNVNVGYNWKKVPKELENKGIKINDKLKELILEFAELRYTSGRSIGYHAGISWANEDIARKYKKLALKIYEELLIMNDI